MEKINDRKMKNRRCIKSDFAADKLLFRVILLIVFAFLPMQVSAQIRAGSGYLKMLHGAREVATYSTLTGALDHTHSFYANPGATGFLRQWQWSATYTNWISDIYDASLFYGGNIRMPWSRRTRFGLGVNYLGIPEFNNAEDQSLPVSGNNLLVAASVGQPLSFLTDYVSCGANVKYFNSQLAGYEANVMIFDAGILLRTPRLTFFRPANGFMDYIIFSTGLSVNNVGQSIQFISEDTPLPRTYRAGAAVNIGAHRGLQFSVATDYRLVRDEDGFLTIGSELSWRQWISLRMGYSFEDNLLGHLTFGGGFRLDDRLLNTIIPGGNNALRFDLASNQNNDYFAAPYHGTMTHQPIGPESFRLIAPDYNALIHRDFVTLNWEWTRDPDLYDDVDWMLIVDQDSTKLARITQIAKGDEDSVFAFLKQEALLVNVQTQQTDFLMSELEGGNYFWSVMAYDMDNHIRFGEMHQNPIAKFRVTAPDPRVIAINFEYSPWITQDTYQGILKFKIQNFGDRIAKHFSLAIYDSLMAQPASLAQSLVVRSVRDSLLSRQMLPDINPGESVILELEWQTGLHGLHRIGTEIANTKRNDKVVNVLNAAFYSIPKGVCAVDDSLIVQEQYHVIYDIPYVGKIYFDNNSAKVDNRYIDDWEIEPPLAIFAKRLKEHPEVKIALQGTIDPNSGEQDLALAKARARAVRDTLFSLGVNFSQMKILGGEALLLRKLPSKAEDARWVLEERRRVDITTDEASEQAIFDPLQTRYIEKTNLPVVFPSKIFGVVPLDNGGIQLDAEGKQQALNMQNAIKDASVVGDILWSVDKFDEATLGDWLDKELTYYVVLNDTLGRQFKSRPETALVTSKIVGRERRYYVLAKFATTAPFYNFYWTSLLDAIPYLLEDAKTRMRFHGHGCATGSNEINNRLSQKRANDFQNKFLSDAGKLYPHLYDEIKRRLDSPKGFGEDEPFRIKSEDGKLILLGDNNAPLGRQLNRRIMVFFYTGR
ncbi:hypothetical protein JXJ21_00540 [candidate division KSB1 bacterium]|nr:hypothetical protein [candidate division KSB1 bacterium]